MNDHEKGGEDKTDPITLATLAPLLLTFAALVTALVALTVLEPMWSASPAGTAAMIPLRLQPQPAPAEVGVATQIAELRRRVEQLESRLRKR